eukprot:CAMPEP_0114351846 /NCGR_PEP_ID=MMETSP0101-20121206/17501_1 /TAXON_ID=38822 ORGANISM="Pteridomonas danica, Strain PT" /NCGR_SAMPLE_ID=MMETSP0101 /ASSEMBLY_ACC=CAM_ASM_000211 /LENGTH=97 /DNA_ID=CAMNT_0001491949 /DNA_START=54 /DNA_END=344 /DNA_ORIENTATION=-
MPFEDDDDEDDQRAQREIEELTRLAWLKSHGFDSERINEPRARFPRDTAVHVAVAEANMDMLIYLHSRNACLTAVNLLGDNPLESSCASVPPEIIAW